MIYFILGALVLGVIWYRLIKTYSMERDETTEELGANKHFLSYKDKVNKTKQMLITIGEMDLRETTPLTDTFQKMVDFADGLKDSINAKAGYIYERSIVIIETALKLACLQVQGMHKSLFEIEGTVVSTQTKAEIQMHIEKKLYAAAQTAYNDSVMKDTPFIGSLITFAVASHAISLKEIFKESQQELMMNEREINELIDNATSKVLNEILEL